MEHFNQEAAIKVHNDYKAIKSQLNDYFRIMKPRLDYMGQFNEKRHWVERWELVSEQIPNPVYEEFGYYDDNGDSIPETIEKYHIYVEIRDNHDSSYETLPLDVLDKTSAELEVIAKEKEEAAKRGEIERSEQLKKQDKLKRERLYNELKEEFEK